jgi:cell division protease FtsH
MSHPKKRERRNPPPARSSNQPKKSGGPLPQQWLTIAWYLIMMLGMLWFWQESYHHVAYRTIPYSEFKARLADGEVVSCSIREDVVLGEIKNKPGERDLAAAAPADTNISHESPTPKPRGLERLLLGSSDDARPEQTGAAGNASSAPGNFMFRTVRVTDPDLVAELESHHVKFSGIRPSFLSEFLWAWVLPIGFMILLWRFLSRRIGGLGQSMMGFGASKARLVAETDAQITFDDVAGCDEAKFELQEVILFLKDPGHYKMLGANIPKGILLVGPPGTGKTLLARAVAGEAKVPFYLISGSDFVELFVGMGAARVRDLFQKAKASAPCIVFIDELDAVGRQRGVHVGAVNDEREQTLNQLLVGMDGFEANVGVIVLAATNRPEVLDRALLRPGRFDRQVVVDAPDLDGREAILKLHTRGKPLAADVDLHRIAQETPGFSGADLANVINEAALLAARHGAVTIHEKDLEDAVEKVVAGPERKSRRLDEETRKRIAYHEVGHALVAFHSEHADPVQKISIIPRGRSTLGYTLQLPTDNQFLLTRAELTDRIKGLLGGRVAEELVFPDVTTGAENDLEHATMIARQMVAAYGMSDRIGLAHCAHRPDTAFPGLPEGSIQRDCSEETARQIDGEVRKILDDAHREAREILENHRDQLALVAGELLRKETLDAAAFETLIEAPETGGRRSDGTREVAQISHCGSYPPRALA